MEAKTAAKEVDAVLRAYIRDTDEEGSNRLLVELMCGYCQPVVHNIVRSRLAVDRTRQSGRREMDDTEDVCNEIILQLLRRVRALKLSGGQDPPSDFSSYVAVTAFNACSRYLRKKYPERHRLKSRLRYILMKRPAFGLWEAGERWLCGLDEWRTQKRPPVRSDELRRLLEDRHLLDHANQQFSSDPVALLTQVFNTLGGPLEIDELVGILSDLCGVQENIRLVDNTGDDGSSSYERIPDPEASHATRVEQQLFLKRLWVEIGSLPLRQRFALLLNLKDPQGRDLASLLAHLRVATLSEIAQVLELSPERFAELWNRLPVDDATIALYLDVTRQQVINLRLSARRRLARRMKGRW
ncbi:MAG TPA: sigma-70 family RNA polymerase sigma factor [Blastocatellia bacterium]|nr:sigma-70 family RNA polymerase sigma factor [Blastocatellia bacterium]